MVILQYFCLAILTLSVQSLPVNNRSLTRNDDPYRLPEDLLEVENYNLELVLEENIFETNQFAGVLDLKFKILQDTNEIKIHANQITFEEVTLLTAENEEITLENTEFVIDSYEFVTITTVETLTAGNTYKFHFVYTALLRTDGLEGFYKSSYTRSDGAVRYLGTTQFQATAARKAFPCFDEPSFKATFDIKIAHPSEYTAIGNTPATSALDPDTQLTVTTFRTTPIMPTYLIAFVVSDFTCSSGVEVEDGLPYDVCSRSETASIRDHAVDLGPKILWAMEEFTGVKYSVSGIGKMHQFAIPDFSAGAMENWGLVTYREYGLLWDPVEGTNRYRQYVATIITHEFAHMWFGDLVTTHWWSDTFLNEGFATYFEWMASAQVEPTWELDKQFIIEELQPALVSDASLSSRALSYPASSPSEVSARFGTVSYSKGASVFRMVSYFMGIERFKAGLNNYLNTYKFKNTKPENLWDSLSPYVNTLPSGLDLQTVMNEWVNRPGFPLLKVQVNGNGVLITQQRYQTSGTPDADDRWYVPISYTLSSDSNRFSDTSARTWFYKIQVNLSLPNVLSGEDSWIVLNNLQSGFYRVDYDRTLWLRIGQALRKTNFDDIPDLNRAQLVDDLYKMAQNGYHSFVEFVEFIEFLENDDSYFSWYQALQAFNYILQRTGEARVRTALIEYFAKLIEVYYNSAPLSQRNDDDQIYSIKRVLAVTWGCRLGLQACAEDAVTQFGTFRSTGTKPDKNLRSLIYCNGIRYSKDISNDWNFLLTEYFADSGTEKSNMLSALGCAQNEPTVTEFLRKSIDSSSDFGSNNLQSIWSAVYTNNYEGIDICLKFLIDNYKTIADFTGTYNSVTSLISNLASRFTRSDQIDLLDNFIESSELPENSKTTARNALANAKVTVQWVEAFEEDLVTFFDLDNDGGDGGDGGDDGGDGGDDGGDGGDGGDDGGDGDGTGSSVSLKAELAIIITGLLLIVQHLIS